MTTKKNLTASKKIISFVDLHKMFTASLKFNSCEKAAKTSIIHAMICLDSTIAK